MSPVHVIVTDDQSVVDAWSAAFAGAIDLYSFASNVEAYERLVTAQAPIDLLVVTDRQSGVFNISAGQLVERIARPPLAGNHHLQGMRVIAVGSRVHGDRATGVTSLESAIRLVKFGEVEQAPAGAPSAAPASATPVGSNLAESLISSIWDKPGAAQPAAQPAIPQAAAVDAPLPPNVQPITSAAPELFVTAPPRGGGQVSGGGPAVAEPPTAAEPVAQAVPQTLGMMAQPQPRAAGSAPVSGGISVDPMMGWSAEAQRALAANSMPAMPIQAMPATAAPASMPVPDPATLAAPIQGPAAAIEPMGYAPAQALPAPAPEPQVTYPVPATGYELPMSDAAPAMPAQYAAPGDMNWPGQQLSEQPAAPAQSGGVFEAPPQLLDRADGDVSFG